MSIIWMKHEKHGRYPCTPSDVDLYRKAGWVPCDRAATKAAEKRAAHAEEEPAFDPNAIVMSSDDDIPEVSEPSPRGRKSKAK